MSFDSHILSLRTLFDPSLAEGFEATVQLRLESQDFRAMVAGGRFEIERGEAAAPDATIATDAATLIDIAHGRRPLADALRTGELSIESDEDVAERFVGLFPLPAPVA